MGSPEKEEIGLGIGSGLLASLCCLGPKVLILLGIGSLFGITGTCMTNYKPIFFLLGILSFLIGFFLLIKSREGECNLETIKKNRGTLVIGFGIMLIIYFLVVSFLVPYINSNLIEAKCTI